MKALRRIAPCNAALCRRCSLRSPRGELLSHRDKRGAARLFLNFSIRALILAATSIAAGDDRPSESDSGTWKVLFDGSSFDGWKKSPGSWTLQDRAAVIDAGTSTFLTREEPLPEDFEMEFECWCDADVELTLFITLKNGILSTLFDVESADARGDGYMSPRVWHKVKLSCRPDDLNKWKIVRSIDGREIPAVDGRTAYSMQFLVTGGASRVAKLRNIRVKDLAKAARGKKSADEGGAKAEPRQRVRGDAKPKRPRDNGKKRQKAR